MSKRMLVLGIVLLSVLFADIVSAAVPSSITVQGRLTDSLGAPLPPGVKGFWFRIFDAPTAGVEIWSGEDQFLATDDDGLWSATLGILVGLNDAVFADTVRWLDVTVNGVTLPRVRLRTVPYAHRASTVDGAAGGTITTKVSIGPGHANTGTNAFAAGESNIASGDWSSIPGGKNNIADDTGSVVAGGGNNRARGKFSVVGGGGGSNPIDSNLASATQSTIVGGTRNVASGQGAFVGGGFRNTASDNSATVAGGSQNTASGSVATIAGGLSNTADGNHAAVGGGRKNYALGDHSTIAGGGGSTGADSNLATGEGTAIGGGSRHVASGRFSTVSGGLHNRADGDFATIAGGGGSFPSDSNVANGRCAAVPGGTRNWANGNYSFAAGRRSRALHGGTFVWGDSTDADFISAAANQFLIRASGGVGIGTNNPDGPLHVQEGSAGSVSGNSNAVAVFERDDVSWLHILSPDTTMRGILFGSPANALMGSIRFNPRGGGEEKGYEIRGRNNNILVEIDSVGNLHSRGSITAVGTCCASDERLKRNIQSLHGGLDKVTCLRGVSYEWKPDESGERIFPSGQQIGLIAQEVQTVVPEAVTEDEDGYLAVDYARLVPLLIEGMKEQQRIIASQNERITTLERKLEQ